MNLPCAIHHPLGKGLRIFTTNRFFALGASELLLNDRRVRETLVRQAVNVLNFPDHSHLLAWSRAPALPEGLTVISGDSRIEEELAPLFSPRRVGLATMNKGDGGLVSAVLETDIRHSLEPEPPPVDVWLTVDELTFMWEWIRGCKPDYDAKRSSRIKLQVMRKLEAENNVVLLVKFQLIFMSKICRLRGRVKHLESQYPVNQTSQNKIWLGNTERALMQRRRLQQ